jgi:hypothetical protein
MNAEPQSETRRWLTARARTFARFLDRFSVRLALSFAIIFSLVPADFVESLDLLFLALFGTEFVMRVWAWAFAERDAPHEGLGGSLDEGAAASRTSRRAWSFVLLLVDFVALASFVPFAVDAQGARWLRMFRLSRLLLLLGYWAPVMRDLYAVIAHRERARQILFMGIVVAGLSFAGAVLLHNLGEADVDVNEDGVLDADDRSFIELLWWSFRQVQDPGNILRSAETLPVVALSLALTVFGLFLVSFLIGLGTDVVREMLELSRLRPAGLHGHTVVVNITPSTRRLLAELMRYYQKLVPSDAPLLSRGWWNDLRRRGFGGPQFLMVGNPAEPPDFLRQPGLSRIVYRQRPEDEEELIGRADLLVAKRIVLLADQTDSAPDAETIRTLLTLVQRLRDRERRGGGERPLGRRRAVVAEILDESNVPAAQAALVTGGRGVRGFIVPTEKLLALFFASVVRRPGLGQLLEELLTSRGHELYTCFFDDDGLGFTMDAVPSLGDSAPAAMDRLLERGVLHREGEPLVVPIGLFGDRSHAVDEGGLDFEVFINPTHTPEGMGHLRGFVGIADNFGAMWSLASSLARERGEGPAEIHAPVEVPALVRTHRRKTTRVLVCGFRPGSVYMLEELFRSDPGGEVLVVVEDEAAFSRTLGALEAHSALVRRGLMHGRHGLFEPQADGLIQFRLSPEGGPASVMHLAVADWMASRHLVDLPRGFGHVADLDAVVFVASQSESADKRTTTALLKLEQLWRDRTRRPRVVAEVIDGRLATRLEQRFDELGIRDIRVFSIQELRAHFLYQSVVVPGFDTVYAELLGSWGQSFVHKHIDPSIDPTPRGPCTFVELALWLRSLGEVLVAVELASPTGRPRLCIAPYGDEPGTRFDLADLRGAWVVAPDTHLQQVHEPAVASMSSTR